MEKRSPALRAASIGRTSKGGSDLNEGVAEALRKRGIDPSEVSNFKVLSDDDVKAFSMGMLADAARLRVWKPETAAEVRERVTEVMQLADEDVLDLMRSRGIEQQVLNLLDEPTNR